MSRSDPPRWPAYLRVPPFVPVPMRSRRDGWTPVRQGEFIGWLAETGSVAKAAALVGCSRESAYRLRRKDGARGFCLAWDAAVAAGDGHFGASWKFTPQEQAAAAFTGFVRVIMRRGRYAGCALEVSDRALLSLMAQLDRAGGRAGAAGQAELW